MRLEGRERGKPPFAPNKKTAGNKGFALLLPVYHEKLNLWDYSKVRKTTKRNSLIKNCPQDTYAAKSLFLTPVFESRMINKRAMAREAAASLAIARLLIRNYTR